MKKSGSILALVLLAAIFGGAVWSLWELQFAAGDVYPAYSTLRSDPSGAKLIFESLGRLPGVTATRSYQLLDRLGDRDSTIVFLGLDPRAFAMQPPADLRAYEAFAGRGNRLVLGMGEGSGGAPPGQSALESSWGVRFGLDFDKAGNDILYFAQARNWQVLDQIAQGPLVAAKTFGNGSIVLVASGRLFGNKAVAEARDTALLARILRPQKMGPHTRIVFDEAHFGIVESGSVMALARRFRLHGLGFGLALCAVLFIWRNASSFPPVTNAAPTEKVLGRTSISGLVTLLRRHIAPDQLASACWQEWRKSHAREVPPGRLIAAEQAVRKLADRPADALREIQGILRAKEGG